MVARVGSTVYELCTWMCGLFLSRLLACKYRLGVYAKYIYIGILVFLGVT